jgi:hypothetical protein
MGIFFSIEPGYLARVYISFPSLHRQDRAENEGPGHADFENHCAVSVARRSKREQRRSSDHTNI